MAVVTSELHVVFLAQLAFPWKIPGQIGLNPSCLMRFLRHSWFSCWHMKSIQGGYPKTLGREANTPWSTVIRRAVSGSTKNWVCQIWMTWMGLSSCQGYPAHCRGICVCRRCSWKIRRTKNSGLSKCRTNAFHPVKTCQLSTLEVGGHVQCLQQ